MAVKPRNAVVAPVVASITVVTLLAANGSVNGRCVFNDSTSLLYLKFGSAASATDHTVQIAASQLYEFPQPIYGGVVTGIWVAANGNARVTEW